jgi:ring-1,2-phenylacetyl-CoA epoxidase subunit PaaD
VVSRAAAPAPAILDRAAVRAALATIVDPEIPTASIVELGMIEAVDVDPRRVRVELLPTFVGCPAIGRIEADIRETLEALAPDREVEVTVDYRTPWTSDRITDAGRTQLRRAGYAPPMAVPPGRALPVLAGDPAAAPATCPYCGSTDTTMDSPFGPALCRSTHHCSACRQPFEAFKPV